MNAVKLEYPTAWLAVMGTDTKHFAQDTKLASAMKLFEMGRFTSGQAASSPALRKRTFCSIAVNGVWTL